MSAIAGLEQDRVVEGIYAVAKKERLRTRSGAPYLALELVDPSGRIQARVWSDVDLLDSRFDEGDAVRVLGRVDRSRDRLQLEIRSLEPAEDLDPEALAPSLRRDGDELAVTCTCGHWHALCGHSLAVLHQLCWTVDRDASVLLHLRGAEREEMLGRLRGGLRQGRDKEAAVTDAAAPARATRDQVDDVEIALDAVLRARHLLEE